jgi:hypothetical protein
MRFSIKGRRVEAMSSALAQLKELETRQTPAQVLKTMIELAIERHFGSGIHAFFSGSLPVFSHLALRQAEDPLVSALAKLIKKAQRDATIVTKAQPHLIAQTLLSILQDPVYENESSRHFLVAAMKAGVVRFLLG